MTSHAYTDDLRLDQDNGRKLSDAPQSNSHSRHRRPAAILSADNLKYQYLRLPTMRRFSVAHVDGRPQHVTLSRLGFAHHWGIEAWQWGGP